jgi:hypothetical protein
VPEKDGYVHEGETVAPNEVNGSSAAIAIFPSKHPYEEATKNGDEMKTVSPPGDLVDNTSEGSDDDDDVVNSAPSFPEGREATALVEPASPKKQPLKPATLVQIAITSICQQVSRVRLSSMSEEGRVSDSILEEKRLPEGFGIGSTCGYDSHDQWVDGDLDDDAAIPTVNELLAGKYQGASPTTASSEEIIRSTAMTPLVNKVTDLEALTLQPGTPTPDKVIKAKIDAAVASCGASLETALQEHRLNP